jgi:wyosine [tRNA(Phe)-imidazoG37] synthetase (radical SAM superfamily)
MSTFLFDKIIFGPIHSRRLGVSLGINLLPVTHKLCNFNCVYCECGLNQVEKGSQKTLPTRHEVYEALETKLTEMLSHDQIPDVITFAGNGEPTLHPEFSEIVDDAILLRNKYVQTAAISVLSNSTMLHKPKVVDALKKVDQNIMKLDSGLLSTIKKLNQPTGNYNLQTISDQLKSFNGEVIIQTLFTHGEINGVSMDNTTEENLQAWVEIIGEILPKKVMIYSLDRDTPYQGLEKVSKEELLKISQRLKKFPIEVMVTG